MDRLKYFYVIEENIKNSKIFELDTYVYKDGYIRFKVNSLKNRLEGKTFKKLLENGLFMTKKERNYNAAISLQRFVGCIYDDITGMDMHHIDKNKSDNRFVNLVPLKSDVNKSIDSLPIEEMIEFGKQKQNEWVKKINKPKRNTLSNNTLLLHKILIEGINRTAKNVHKIFRNKIKSIKVIYSILNTYFYVEEFLKFLKCNKINIFDN